MLQVDPSGDGETVVFFKTKPTVITPDNLHTDISVSTMNESPINALYHSVQKVFAPLLLKVKLLMFTFIFIVSSDCSSIVKNE